jgi:hypothetical protein
MELETYDRNGMTVTIYQEDYTGECNPRDWDNLGRMICFHDRYTLGDVCKHKAGKSLPCLEDATCWFTSPEDFQAWYAGEVKAKRIAVALPLWLYDHSGISMSCGERTYPYNDPWDSGGVGVIFVTRDKLLQEYGTWDNGKLIKAASRVTKTMRAKAEKCLQQEVETYSAWLQGEVYGYRVDDADGNLIDSCGGFVGELDYCKEQANDAADSHELQPNYSI